MKCNPPSLIKGLLSLAKRERAGCSWRKTSSIGQSCGLGWTGRPEKYERSPLRAPPSSYHSAWILITSGFYYLNALQGKACHLLKILLQDKVPQSHELRMVAGKDRWASVFSHVDKPRRRSSWIRKGHCLRQGRRPLRKTWTSRSQIHPRARSPARQLSLAGGSRGYTYQSSHLSKHVHVCSNQKKFSTFVTMHKSSTDSAFWSWERMERDTHLISGQRKLGKKLLAWCKKQQLVLNFVIFHLEKCLQDA